MIANSNIRRIDELGRIVIPKDIRKKLHIRDNEPLEIFVENEEIKIKKYSVLPEIIDYIKYLVDMGNRTTGNDYIITDRDHIIASSNQILKDTPLSKELEDMACNCKEEKNVKIDYMINGQRITGHANIIPLIIDNDRTGLIIEYSDRDLPFNNVIRIFKNIIESRLED